MCGINGFNFCDENMIQKMNQKIKYRGPDDDGIFLDSKVSLGHTRLSILDLSSAGHQPMLSNDQKQVIVFNGEIYNYQELRQELKDKYVFNSNSDTEVLLALYQNYQQDMLAKLKGIFSFAIWDLEKKQLFLARDRFGVKPLFYYWDGARFVFSSEMKCLLLHDFVKKEIDGVSLNLYLRFSYIDGPRTIFRSIKKVSPGHYLILSESGLEIKKYYSLQRNYPVIDNYQTAKKMVRECFDKAVERQIISDKPVGLFLSGGIDSTAILGSMHKQLGGKIKTFSVWYDIQEKADKYNSDHDIAQKTSHFYSTDHYGLFVKSSDMIENFDHAVYHMNDIVSNHVQISMYLLSKMAKEQVDVVLSGDGGDEVFGGYARYYYFDIIDKIQKIPAPLRKNYISRHFFKLLKKDHVYEKINSDSALELYWNFRSQKENIIRRYLNSGYNKSEQAKDHFYQKYFKGQSMNYTDLMMIVDIQSWLVDQAFSISDTSSMAHGLELRVPMLDNDLVDLSMKIPKRFKINNADQGKYVFKEAVRDYLPDEVYNKPKSGWFSPAAKWLRQPDFQDYARQVLSEKYNEQTREYFNFQEIDKLYSEHVERKQYHLNILWSLLTFQIWYRNLLK